MKDIEIYRSRYDCPINYFFGRCSVDIKEVVLIEREVFGKKHIYAEPRQAGRWSFGGTFLFTSNGIFSEFCKTPIPLHDRDMNLETKGAAA